MRNLLKHLSPLRLLGIGIVFSLLTAWISFDIHEFSKDDLLIFTLYYLILIIAALLATFGKDKLSPYTVAISQMGYIFLGFSLFFISLLRLLQGSLGTFITGFFLTGLPGIALMWAGIQLFRPKRNPANKI